MNTIELNKLTAYEQEFVKVALANFNDLMFTTDIDYKNNATLNIPKKSLGGVISSLVKKGIIMDFSNTGDPRDKDVFLFTSQEDDTWNKPVLI